MFPIIKIIFVMFFSVEIVKSALINLNEVKTKFHNGSKKVFDVEFEQGKLPTGPGQPLFLTKYIEKGQLEAARELSQVQSFVGNVRSYAGYLTVDKKFNSNLFFWYFVSENNSQTDPTVVWLQGGPGTTSLFGIFVENGPFIITPKEILRRQFSWSTICNIIYIDNPVGTGYSFTKSTKGYSRNQIQVGDNLYKAIIQIFKLFPELIATDLYITGESYAGKYIPAFAYTIHKQNREKPEIAINLKGLMIGNGFTDPGNMMRYGDYLFELGLIDEKAKHSFHRTENEALRYIRKHEWKKASHTFDRLVGNEKSLFYKYTGLKNYYNYYNSHSGDWEDFQQHFILSNRFRSHVHVGNTRFNNGLHVYKHLYKDVPKSVVNWVVELLQTYRILFYNGQLDIICAYPLTQNFIQNMKWPDQKGYKKAKRHVYKINGEVIGYYKTVGSLTEMLVRNAGHMVPADQPEWALEILHDFIHNNVSRHLHVIETETAAQDTRQ